MKAKRGRMADDTGWPRERASGPVEIVVVTSPGCHLCVRALEEIGQLAAEVPVILRTVDIDSPEGAEVLQVHRPPAPPAFLVDGEFFGFGRLPHRKLRRLLQKRASA